MSTPSAAAAARSTIDFHVTGFGEFQGVKSNPTEQLVHTLPSYLSAHPLPDNVRVSSLTVLETSGAGSREALQHLRQAATAAAAAPAPAPTVDEDQARVAPVAPTCHRIWLHFGVHDGSQQFKLESTAYNLADFRCPDQRGWTPQSQPIVSDDQCAAAAGVCTGLDVGGLCGVLGADGWKVCVSTDPGRFVCNWIFFHSLRACADQRPQLLRDGCVEHALFVHVPAHDVYSLEQQQKFARDVILQIAHSLQTADVPVAAVTTPTPVSAAGGEAAQS